MPLDGSDVASAPSGTNGVPNTAIESSKYNAFVADVYAIFNTVRTIAKGYTGASTAIGAANNLEVASYGAAQSLTIAQQIQAQANINVAPRGHIFGLTLSNSVSDSTNDIDIAAGDAASSDTTPNRMILAAALTKRLDAAWAVGTGNGGLDTGSIANTTYHIWLIQRSDTGVVDALFSTSATSPTMPSNYDRKRRIGSIIRASSAIVLFSQTGDRFLRAVPNQNYSTGNPGTSAVSVALGVPTGIKVTAIVAAIVIDSTAATSTYSLFTSPDQTDTTPASNLYNHFVVSSSTASNSAAPSEMQIRTNTSAQIRFRLSQSTADHFVEIYTNGWIDRRGRDA